MLTFANSTKRLFSRFMVTVFLLLTSRSRFGRLTDSTVSSRRPNLYPPSLTGRSIHIMFNVLDIKEFSADADSCQ